MYHSTNQSIQIMINSEKAYQFLACFQKGYISQSKKKTKHFLHLRGFDWHSLLVLFRTNLWRLSQSQVTKGCPFPKRFNACSQPTNTHAHMGPAWIWQGCTGHFGALQSVHKCSWSGRPGTFSHSTRLEVCWNGGTPPIIHLKRIFHHKPFGVPPGNPHLRNTCPMARKMPQIARIADQPLCQHPWRQGVKKPPSTQQHLWIANVCRTRHDGKPSHWRGRGCTGWLHQCLKYIKATPFQHAPSSTIRQGNWHGSEVPWSTYRADMQMLAYPRWEHAVNREHV